MHTDDLKAIWFCRECKTVFVFTVMLMTIRVWGDTT